MEERERLIDAVEQANRELDRLREPMEAAKWVGALPVGRLRSAGALVIAKGLVESDPEMAGQWLQQAGDDPGRAAVQEMLDGRR
jgi:hypothetical protein